MKPHLPRTSSCFLGLGLLLAALLASGCAGSTEQPAAAARTRASGSPRSEATQKSAASPDRRRGGWQLVWRDEFSEPTCPDRAKWAFEHGFVRNRELQWYEPGNASCSHGVLTLEARRARKRNTDYNPGSRDWSRNRRFAAYTSASMATKRAFTYGRFVMRARIDTGEGLWPAFWTLGRSAGWPWSGDVGAGWPHLGEVDIMEYYRKTLKANVCKPAGYRCDWSSVEQPLASLGGTAWANRFHVWAMDWNPRSIDLFLDGKLVNHFRLAEAVGPGKQNPYIGRPEYMLLSLAVGGTKGGDPARTGFPARCEVDYVRVYQRRPTAAEAAAG
jgi:beta-glucanase (GH16 family)